MLKMKKLKNLSVSGYIYHKCVGSYSQLKTHDSMYTCTFSTMASCIPDDNITQEIMVPSRRNTVQTILVDVELRHDGQHAQQQLAAAGQQQQAN